MKMIKNSFTSASMLFTFILVFSSCKKENNAPDTYYGTAVTIGSGTGRSYFVVAKDGTPLKLGVELTDNALTNLPTDPANFAASTFQLSFDQKAKDLTPYDRLEIGWNVNGHEPAGIFNVPHFDFHFYQMTVAEQSAIPPYQVDSSKFNILPPPDYIPAGYIRGPGGVPQMGVHWSDVSSPEFNGQPFTYTMVYGSYNGKVVFIEPMITLAFLKSGSTIEKEIKQPVKFSPVGKWYPTTYTIYKDASNGNHYVELKNFVKK